MKVVDIAFVCYAVSDLKRGRKFYEGALGLKPTKTYFMKPDESLGMVEYDVGPATLAIGCGAPLFKPGPGGGVAALEVDDLDEAMRSLKAANATIIMDRHENPPCTMAVISDPDGNVLMIHRRKNR